MHEGRKLKNVELVGTQDPFVKATLGPGGTIDRTKARTDGGQSPRWTKRDENEFEFLVVDADSAILTLDTQVR